MKTKTPTKAPVQKHQLKKYPPSKPSYTSVVRNELQPYEKNRPTMSNCIHTAPASNTNEMNERKHYRNDLTTKKTPKKSQKYRGMNNCMNYPNKRNYYNPHFKQVRRFRPNNIYRDEQTTFIGREVLNYL